MRASAAGEQDGEGPPAHGGDTRPGPAGARAREAPAREAPGRDRETAGTLTPGLVPEGTRDIIRRAQGDVARLAGAMPEAVAAMLSHRQMAEVFVNSADPRLLIQVYRGIRDRMESASRRALLKRIARRIAGMAFTLSETRRSKKPFDTRAFRPGDADWDMDASLERLVENPRKTVAYEDVRTQVEDPSRIAVCFMVDKSQSVSAVLHDVAVACAMACHALRNEMLSVLVFDKAVEFIRRFGDESGPEQIVERLLDMDSGGATDLFKPLLAAHQEISGVPASHERRGVMISDLVATRGLDPLGIAAEIPSLQVVCVPGFRDESPALAAGLGSLPNVMYRKATSPGAMLEEILAAVLSIRPLPE